jgi:hypothetical protein
MQDNDKGVTMADEPTIADYISKAESDMAKEKAAEAVRLSAGTTPKRRGRPPKNPSAPTPTKTVKPTPQVDKGELHDFVDTVRLRQQQFTLRVLARLGYAPEDVFVDPHRIAIPRKDSNIKPQFQQYFASDEDVDYVTEKISRLAESQMIAKLQDSKPYKILMAVSAVSDLVVPMLNSIKLQMQILKAAKDQEEATLRGEQPQQAQPQEQSPTVDLPLQG